MKLQALRAFVAAINDGSLRRAAKRLGVSQPALSKTLRELELELATTLLLRSTRGVVPTAQGKVLYTHACAAARELERAVEEIGQLEGRMVGELGITAVPLAVMLLIPEALRTFSRAFPDIQLRISEELYIAQLARLRRGEAEIAIGPIPADLPQGEFVVEPLIPVSMAVVVRKGSPLQGATRLAELAAARWVYTGVSGSTGYAHELFVRNGLAPPPTGAVVNSTLALLAVIAASDDYVGLLPAQLAAHPVAAHLSVVPIVEGALELTLGAIVREEQALSVRVRHFLSHLHRAAHHAEGLRGGGASSA